MVRTRLITWDDLAIVELERMHPDFDVELCWVSRALVRDESKEMQQQMSAYDAFTRRNRMCRIKGKAK